MKLKLLPSHSHWRMNKTFKQPDFYVCWSSMFIARMNPVCLKILEQKAPTLSLSLPFEIQQHETLGRTLWVRKYTDTAFTVLLLAARVSNPHLHKTSHPKLRSKTSERCRHFTDQSNTRREKQHIKKLIHNTNYLWWVGRTHLAELH